MFVGKENSRNNLEENRGKFGCHSDNANLLFE